MKRGLLNLLTVTSLLLCAAAAVLWVRNSWTGDSAVLKALGREWVLMSVDGRACVAVWPAMSRQEKVRPPTDVRMWTFAEFGWITYRLGSHVVRSLVIPYWFLVLGFAALPVYRTGRTLRARAKSNRQRRGLCPKCGYDLRATPGRCPECGTEAAPNPAPKCERQDAKAGRRTQEFSHRRDTDGHR
jgi:hypothetical protein